MGSVFLVDMVDTDHMVDIMVDTADTVDMVDTADMVATDTVDIEVVGMVVTTVVAGDDKVLFLFSFFLTCMICFYDRYYFRYIHEKQKFQKTSP